jgi:NAD(P)H dehydrogenase (quinone)
VGIVSTGGEIENMRRIAVTGASGSLGGQVVRLLAEQTEADVVALSRRPTAVPPRVIARIADYADGGALRNGLADVDTLVFISSDGEGTRVLAHHLNVVAAARDCGVAHIVALSGVDADVDSPFCYAVTNGLTEQAIRKSGCGFSVVRASIFAEFFRHFLLPARTTGQLSVPAGDGRIGLVSKGDVGRCLAALARCEPTGRCHEVTGPAALDTAAIAATAAQAWVRPVAYRPISAAAYMAQAAATEDPWWLYAYTSMFASIREQRWDRVTADVQHLTGRDPRHLGEILDETTPSGDAR